MVASSGSSLGTPPGSERDTPLFVTSLEDVHAGFRVIRGRLSILESQRPAQATMEKDVEELASNVRLVQQCQANLKHNFESLEHMLSERISGLLPKFANSQEASELALRRELGQIRDEAEAKQKEYRQSIKGTFAELEREVDHLSQSVAHMSQEHKCSIKDVQIKVDRSLREWDNVLREATTRAATELSAKLEELRCSISYCQEKVNSKAAVHEEMLSSHTASLRSTEEALRKGVAQVSDRSEAQHAEQQRALKSLAEQLEARLQQEVDCLTQQHHMQQDKASRVWTSTLTASEHALREEFERTAGDVEALLDRARQATQELDGRLSRDVAQLRQDCEEMYGGTEQRLAQSLQAWHDNVVERLARAAADSEALVQEQRDAMSRLGTELAQKVADVGGAATQYTDARSQQGLEACQKLSRDLERKLEAELQQSAAGLDAKQRAYHTAVDQSLRSLDERVNERITGLAAEQTMLHKQVGDELRRAVEEAESRLADRAQQLRQELVAEVGDIRTRLGRSYRDLDKKLGEEVCRVSSEQDLKRSEGEAARVRSLNELRDELSEAVLCCSNSIAAVEAEIQSMARSSAECASYAKEIEARQADDKAGVGEFLEQVSNDLRHELSLQSQRADASVGELREDLRSMAAVGGQAAEEARKLSAANLAALKGERHRTDELVAGLENRLSDLWSEVLRVAKEQQEGRRESRDQLLASHPAARSAEPELNLVLNGNVSAAAVMVRPPHQTPRRLSSSAAPSEKAKPSASEDLDGCGKGPLSARCATRSPMPPPSRLGTSSPCPPPLPGHVGPAAGLPGSVSPPHRMSNTTTPGAPAASKRSHFSPGPGQRVARSNTPVYRGTRAGAAQLTGF